MKRQAKKVEFGISRNGEHVECGLFSREEAEARITARQAEDQKMVGRWITARQAADIQYHITEISGRRIW